MKDLKLKKRARELRAQGHTFTEINKILRSHILKSTLSCWCKGIKMDAQYRERIRKILEDNLSKIREKAWATNRIKRKKYLADIYKRNVVVKNELKKKTIAKITLATLYLAEGKKGGSSVVLGNSDPGIIKLFLRLLNTVYAIDHKKMHCTLQCRADQDIKTLQKYWSEITGIPLSQFYKVRIDPRTLGKRTVKEDYKGVCRIDYISSRVFTELMIIGKILMQ